MTARNRITGKQFSLLTSGNSLSYGLMKTLDIFLGMPLMSNPQLELQLHNERSRFVNFEVKRLLVKRLKKTFNRYLVAELQALDQDGLKTFCSFLIEKLESGSQDDQVPSQVPFQFRTSQGLEIDLSLFDGQIMSKAKPRVNHLLVKGLKEGGWVAEMRREIVNELMSKQTPEDIIQQTTEKLLATEYKNRVCKLILSDSELAMLGSEVPQLLVDQLKTSLVIQEVLKEEQTRLNQHKKQVEVELEFNHPLLSRIKPWMKRQLEKADQKFREQRVWEPHTKAIEGCQAESLFQSAYFLSRDLSFRKDRESVLRKELQQLELPEKEFSFESRIWMPKYWTVTRRKKSKNGGLSDKTEVIPTVIIDQNDEEMSDVKDPDYVYELEKFKTTKTTSRFGWRWRNFFHRTMSHLWNLLFWLGLAVPFSSPVSFTALVKPDPFYPDYELNQANGNLVRSKTSRVLTLTSRLRDLWNHVRQNRQDFEQSQDTGLISKSVMRYWNLFVNYVLKGTFGTLFYTLILPPIILAISTVSLALAITAPIYIWPLSICIHSLAFLFFDFEGSRALDALVWNAIYNVAIGGVIQPILAAAVAFVICPLGSMLIAVGALFRKGARDAWDTIIYQTLIKKRARIPIKDGFLARRIAGPGLAAHHLYQIKTEQALVALETKMELDQLESFEREIKERVWKPFADYKIFVEKILGPFKVQPQHNTLRLESEALEAKLAQVVEKRNSTLNQRLPKDGIRNRVRLYEVDLKIVLKEGARMAKEFYSQHVLSKLCLRDQEAFWFDRGLMADDWLGLASILLSATFSQDFLTPLQEADLSFQLKVL